MPVDWWDKTEVFDLPFKVIFDIYKGHLTIIEVNREHLQEAVIKNISFQFERNFPLPPAFPYFLNSASNHNFGVEFVKYQMEESID
jgi:hypothetical protein